MEEFVVTDRRRVNGDGQSMVIVDAALRELPSEVRMLESTMREQLRTLTTSELLARYQFARQAGISFNGARDEYEILGYDRTITTQQYREEYLRGGIAGRIVDALPNATWRGQMELIEDQDPDKITPFEQAWEDQDTRLQIQAKLLRVDKLAGLSTYAVLLIGAGGNMDTELPKARKPEDLLYLTPFSGGGGPTLGQMTRNTSFDADATIREFDVDPQSPRFGLPLFYQLKRTDLTVSLAKPVHWTRIIHIAENLLDDEVYGLPALERVWNLLSDLRKVTGGGAEAFWLRANQGLHLDIDKDMTLPDVKNAVDSLKDQADAYKHQLTRWLRTKGVKAEVLGSDVANFNSPAEAVLTQIAGAKAIPKRILMGSEMGELASSQDRDNWKDQVNGRQTGYAGPYIVRPLVKRLIQYGYLPMPKKGEEEYEVRWPQITTMTEQEKTAGATAWAAVNASQKNAGQGPTFTDSEIREKWADKAPLTDEQKTELAEQQQEKLKQQQEMMKAQGKGPDGRPVDEEVPPGKKKGPDEHDKELAKEVKKKAIQFVKRAAQEEHDDELIRVLQDAMETGAVDVVAAIIGLGGTGSGNYGHVGRPGAIGGSGSREASHPTHPLPDNATAGSAVYRLDDQDEGDLDTEVIRNPDGSYYARADNFDFGAKDAESMREKLKKYKATYIGWERPRRDLGGPGSGNHGHAGRPGEVGGSASDDARATFNGLKAEWSRTNDELFRHIDDPSTPEALALIQKQKEIVQRMHTLEADPGGLEGVGLPGGARDVVIIGAGPAGYSAAVMGGAEGLDTLLVEATPIGGGQAKFSSRVENLPGYPAGVTGDKLAADMHEQAERMGAELRYGVSATGIEYDPVTDLKTVTLSDGTKIDARSVIIAGGVQFKRGEFEGADAPNVTYGDSRSLARMGAGKDVVVAGGSNGAAQAALLAAQSATHVALISRKPIDISMSDYQVHALRNHPRITVMEGEEIAKISGETAYLKSGKEIGAGAVGVFFGGRPQTDWLPKEIKREKTGKIIANAGLETDIPGVFAVGDVRHGSASRIGTAIGDGQFATHSVFQYYERMKRIEKAFKR